MVIHPYLDFEGNCREAFEFYRSCFGGSFTRMVTFGQGPEDMKVAPEHADLIMHVSLPVGSTVLMGSDALQRVGQPPADRTGFSLSVQLQDRERVREIFAGLSRDGEVTMALHDAFWGAYFGMVTDRFGVRWMLSCEQ